MKEDPLGPKRARHEACHVRLANPTHHTDRFIYRLIGWSNVKNFTFIPSWRWRSKSNPAHLVRSLSATAKRRAYSIDPAVVIRYQLLLCLPYNLLYYATLLPSIPTGLCSVWLHMAAWFLFLKFSPFEVHSPRRLIQRIQLFLAPTTRLFSLRFFFFQQVSLWFICFWAILCFLFDLSVNQSLNSGSHQEKDDWSIFFPTQWARHNHRFPTVHILLMTITRTHPDCMCLIVWLVTPFKLNWVQWMR